MFLKSTKRRANEEKFSRWIKMPNGGRKYWLEIEGRGGYKARYVKEVDGDEETLKFYQEIYDEKGIMIEVHEKYPVNKGHKKIIKGGGKDDKSD